MSKALREQMQSYVETDALPGLVYLAASGGDVTVETLGTVAYDSDRPMARDSVFRIASISKPITAAAAMILVEDGTIRLDEPVDRLLPELADRRVLRSLESDLDDTVPARRPILIEDLLTLRMGFGSILTEPGRYPIQRGRGRARPGHPRLALTATGTHRRRVDRRPRDPAAHRAPGGALALQHRLPGARRPGRTRRRAAAGGLSAGAAVRAAGDGRHRFRAPPGSAGTLHHPIPAGSRRWPARGLRSAGGWLLEPPDRSAGRRLVAAVHRRRPVGVRPDAQGRRRVPGRPGAVGSVGRGA